MSFSDWSDALLPQGFQISMQRWDMEFLSEYGRLLVIRIQVQDKILNNYFFNARWWYMLKQGNLSNGCCRGFWLSEKKASSWDKHTGLVWYLIGGKSNSIGMPSDYFDWFLNGITIWKQNHLVQYTVFKNHPLRLSYTDWYKSSIQMFPVFGIQQYFRTLCIESLLPPLHRDQCISDNT